MANGGAPSKWIGLVARGVGRQVVVESEAGTGEGQPRVTIIDVPVAVKVVRTPPRERRLLWDQFHSLAYPSAFVPRDNLGETLVSFFVFVVLFGSCLLFFSTFGYFFVTLVLFCSFCY